MTWLPYFFTWLSGVLAGLGVAYSGSNTSTGNGIAAIAYIAAFLVGGLALIAGFGWN